MAFFEGFEGQAAAALEGVAAQLREIKPVDQASCVLSEIGERDRDTVAAEIRAALGPSRQALYAISLPEADPAAIHAALNQARSEKRGERSYSRVLPLTDTATPLLYVGSSQKLNTRLMDHLGFRNPKTSSLHIRFWGHGLGAIKVDVRYYSDSVSNDLLCRLEDFMADQLRPLFGKRGSV